MELWQVTVTWRDVTAEREWNRIVNEQHGRNIPPMPDRKRATTHVAVFGAFGHEQITEAGRLAVLSVVGNMNEPGNLEKWQPVVEGAMYIGSVAVQEPAREESPDALRAARETTPAQDDKPVKVGPDEYHIHVPWCPARGFNTVYPDRCDDVRCGAERVKRDRAARETPGERQ